MRKLFCCLYLNTDALFVVAFYRMVQCVYSQHWTYLPEWSYSRFHFNIGMPITVCYVVQGFSDSRNTSGLGCGVAQHKLFSSNGVFSLDMGNRTVTCWCHSNIFYWVSIEQAKEQKQCFSFCVFLAESLLSKMFFLFILISFSICCLLKTFI